jgi:hypothetical protein
MERVPTVKTYKILLTKDEILKVEEALYDRASVLYAIGSQLEHAGSNQQSKNIDKRASELEHIASLIAYPIDEEYIRNYNGIQ